MPGQLDYDLIRDYLHGLLDSQTSREIAELIANDENAKSIAEGILCLEREFKNNEQKIEAYLGRFQQKQLGVIEKHVAPHRRYAKWFKVAAAVLMLVAVIFFSTLRFDQPEVLTLVEEHLANPYPVAAIIRGQQQTTTPFESGLGAYAAGDYFQAIRHFERAKGAESDMATLTFYFGLSNLYTGNAAKAIESLQSEILAESRYAEQARWHLALALIKEGSTQRAKEILSLIEREPRHYKREAAMALMDRLN